MSPEPKAFQSEDNCLLAAQSLQFVCGLILFSFAKHDCTRKDVIIRHFVAKTSMSLKGIFSLWDMRNYQDAWMIHRGMLDRLFHLHSIGTKNEFGVFDDWSFFRKYSAQNRVKSDAEFKHEAVGPEYEITPEQRERIRRLSANPPVWNRPRAEDVAKEMDLEFLYKYGYDFASMHVHPMSDDGQQDFFSITKLEPAPNFPSQITLLHNSILVATIIVQDAVNFSSFRWRQVIWTFLTDMREFLDTGDLTYQTTVTQLSKFIEENDLCEPA